jgi:hypothetical protein
MSIGDPSLFLLSNSRHRLSITLRNSSAVMREHCTDYAALMLKLPLHIISDVSLNEPVF